MNSLTIFPVRFPVPSEWEWLWCALSSSWRGSREAEVTRHADMHNTHSTAAGCQVYSERLPGLSKLTIFACGFTVRSQSQWLWMEGHLSQTCGNTASLYTITHRMFTLSGRCTEQGNIGNIGNTLTLHTVSCQTSDTINHTHFKHSRIFLLLFGT